MDTENATLDTTLGTTGSDGKCTVTIPAGWLGKTVYLTANGTNTFMSLAKVTVTEPGVSYATVTFNFQQDGEQVVFGFDKKVASDLAESYGYTDEVESATVIIGLDEDKALEALRTQGNRISIPQELNDDTTLTSVPHYMVKEGVDESSVDYNSSDDLHLWAEVTWQSSNPSVIGIGSNTTKLYAPYTVKVSRPKTDTSVTLTAALTYSGRDDLKVYFTYTVTVKGTQKAIEYQEGLELWLSGGTQDPYGALYVPATGAKIDVNNVTTDIHFPTTSDMRSVFADNYGADFDGKYTPIPPQRFRQGL